MEAERKKMLNNINTKYASLQKDVYEYEKKFGAKHNANFIPFHELAEILHM